MLHLIPAPLHRAGLRLAHGLRRRWWRLSGTQLRGSRVLAFNPAGEVLLIRHSYGSGAWMLPGGGIGRGEDPLAAALRELREETACLLLAARVFAVVDEPLYGTRNQVHLVCGVTEQTPCCDGREVIEARFFAPAQLPASLSPMLKARFAEWLEAAEFAGGRTA